MNTNELTAAVRTRLGKLEVANTVDIEDADIIREGGYTINRIADRITKDVLRSITSVANQREYDVQATTLRVKEVYPPGASLEEEMRLGSQMVSSGNLDAAEEYFFPSLYLIRKAREAAALAKIRFTFHPIERKLKIDPTPSVGGQKYYYISVEKAVWTLTALPTDFEELVVLGTYWACLNIVALRRSTEGGILREGGFVNYPATELKAFVDAAKEEFERLLQEKTMLYALR